MKRVLQQILKIKKEQAREAKIRKYTIKLVESDTQRELIIRSALFQTMNKNKSFNRNPTNHALYHDLREALIEDENAMDKGVADTVKNHKRQHDDDDDKDDDEDPSDQPRVRRLRGEELKTEESVKEPTAEVEIDDVVNTATEDVVHDDVQPHDASEPKTDVTPKHNWFKQPPRPPTPD
ncbi:hypothetical protein Tco_0436456 [Tanacetum coccineum]